MSGGRAEIHTDSDYLVTGTHDGASGSSALINGGFELGGGATGWTVEGEEGDALITSGTEQRTGSLCIGLQNGGGGGTYYHQTMTVSPGASCRLSFWTKGDGSVAGRYAVYDLTHSDDIVGVTSTSVTEGTYAEVSEDFTIPSGCTSISLRLYVPASAGVAYFDDVDLIVNVTTLLDRKGWFLALGVMVGKAIENATQDTVSTIATVTDTEITTDADIAWDNGDTYKIYKTATKGSLISTQWVDVSRGWKTPMKELEDGWRPEDVDLNSDGAREVWGPGQPENYRK